MRGGADGGEAGAEVCLGCGEEHDAGGFSEAVCGECGGAFGVCETCAAGAVRVMCGPCIDEVLPWLGAYVRLRLAALSN